MRAAGRILTIATFIALALAIGAARADQAGGERAFLHRPHLAAGTSCADCHGAIPADRGLRRVLPDGSVCVNCHEQPLGFETRRAGLRAVNFVHSEHREHLGDCAACHEDPDRRPARAGSHAVCGGCHAHERDLPEMLCGKCHRDMTSAGLGALSRFTHRGNFLSEHGQYASRSIRTCSQCHREAFCTACHGRSADLRPSVVYPEAAGRSFIHRGDWITVHRIESRTDSARCLTCHARSECETCHARRGASTRSTPGAFRHPAGWMSRHGGEARADIVSCAACHERGQVGDCIACHRVSVGSNPHPPGWEDRAGRLSRSDRMCAICHDN